MTGGGALVVFSLHDHRYALPLATVERVVHAVAVTPLPQAPATVMGIIDVAGQILPVFNLRRRFRLPERRLLPDDQLILARTERRTVALPVDSTHGILDGTHSEVIAPGRIMAGLAHLRGVLRLEDGLVLIQDLAQFLSLDEERDLQVALERKSPRPPTA